MTELNISMSLTLADAASGPLRTFAEGMAQLKANVTGVGTNLEKIATGITNVGKAAASASAVNSLASSLNALAPAMAKVRAEGAATATSLGNIGSRASAGVRGTYALEQAMAALGGTLSRSIEKLTATATGLGMIGTEARAAGVGVAAGARAMEGALVPVNTQATGLSSTLKGLAALWAAMKIEKGISASISEAGEFQQATKSVEALNLGVTATTEIINKAWDDSRALKYVSALDAIKVRMNLIAGLAEPMNPQALDAIARPVMQLVNNLKFLGDATEAGALGKNIMGIFETRGQTADPAAMQRTMDLIQRASAVTHGNVTVRDIDTFLRGVGAGAQNLSDEGIMRTVELINQEKISGGSQGGGGGASRLSTQVKLLQAYATGKAMNKQGAEMLIESDILTPGAIREDGSAVLSRNVKPGGVKNAQLAVSDPIKWIEQNAGKIIAYTQRHQKEFYPQGADMNDPANIDAAVQKFLVSLGFTVTATKLLSSATNPRTQARIENGVGMQRQAMTSDQFADSIKDTYQQNVTKFDKSLENLKITIGTTILPAITSMLEKFAVFTSALAAFAQDHPTITHLAVLAAGIIGVKMAISGISSVFGIVGKLSSALLGMSGSAAKGMVGAAEGVGMGGTLLGSRLSALSTTVGAVMTRIGGFFMRAIPFVGWLLVAWDVAQLVGNLEVGGKKISDWATELGAGVSRTFKNMWISTREYFGFLTADAAEAMRKANNLAALQSRDSRTDLLNGPLNADQLAGKNAAMKYLQEGSGEHLTPEEIRAKQLEDAANAKAGPKVKGAAATGRFKNYDDELDKLKEYFRLAEDADKRDAEVMKRQLAANLISVDDYYDEKLAKLQASIADEVGILQKEKARVLNTPGADGKVDHAAANRLDGDIKIKQRDLQTGTTDIELERKQALLKLDKEAAVVQRDLLKVSGDRKEAELQRMRDEVALTDAVLVKNGFISQADADAHQVQIKAAQDYAEQYKQIAVIQESYAEKLAEIDDQERNGTLAASTAEEQKLALRKEEAAVLDDLIAKLRVLAAAGKLDPATTLALDKMGKGNRSTLGQNDADTVQMLNATRSGFENLFSTVLNGSASGAKAIEQFAQSIKHSFLDIIGKKLGDQLFNSLFSTTDSSGGGSDGLLTSLFKMGAGFLGFGGGTANTALGGGGTQPSIDRMDPGVVADSGSTNLFAADVPSFAVGIDYVPHDMLAFIHEGESINTKHETAAGRRGGHVSGKIDVHHTFDDDVASTRVNNMLDAYIEHAMATR